MKIVAIIASPRGMQGNTGRLLDEVLAHQPAALQAFLVDGDARRAAEALAAATANSSFTRAWSPE